MQKPTQATVTKLPKQRRRSEPPNRLNRPAKAIWRRTWAACPPGHFRPENLDMLATYCSMLALFEKTGKEVDALENMVDSDGKIDPRIRLYADLTAKISTLATKLRLAVSSHTDSKFGKRADAKPDQWWKDRKK